MLEINYIQEHKASVIEKLKKRHIVNASNIVEEILFVNQQRKKIQSELNANSSNVKQLTKEIEKLLLIDKQTDILLIKEEIKTLKAFIKNLEEKLQICKEKLQNYLYELPNLPNENVPIGKSAADNEIIYTSDNIPPTDPHTLPHWEIASKYNIIDFELGNKLTGSGFPVYKGKGAKLQRALINFFLDEATKVGYEEIQPPILVNKASAYGTGQLPDKEGMMYELLNEALYLIPTAEVPITNLYRDEIILKTKLPIRHVAYTPCFRREAGSWGSHVRGLNRLHQFDKVELVEISLPQFSYQALENMRMYIEGLIKKLGLPYRVLKLCSGDLGFTSAFTYDIEVYSVGQKRWLEVSSISNFETYQSNRMQIRYKEDKQMKLLHTLNGSAIALPRIMAALLELNSIEGKVKIPGPLKAYIDFEFIY